MEIFYGRSNYEIIKRTANGNYSVDVYGVPIKYEDKNGEINYIDTSIKKRELFARAFSKYNYKNAFGENTALEYVNINTGVKENLILYKNIGINEFEFVFSSNTHTPILAKDNKSISIINNATGEIDYHFLPLYAYDSYSGDKDSSSILLILLNCGI